LLGSRDPLLKSSEEHRSNSKGGTLDAVKGVSQHVIVCKGGSDHSIDDYVLLFGNNGEDARRRSDDLVRDDLYSKADN